MSIDRKETRAQYEAMPLSELLTETGRLRGETAKAHHIYGGASPEAIDSADRYGIALTVYENQKDQPLSDKDTGKWGRLVRREIKAMSLQDERLKRAEGDQNDPRYQRARETWRRSMAEKFNFGKDGRSA